MRARARGLRPRRVQASRSSGRFPLFGGILLRNVLRNAAGYGIVMLVEQRNRSRSRGKHKTSSENPVPGDEPREDGRGEVEGTATYRGPRARATKAPTPDPAYRPPLLQPPPLGTRAEGRAVISRDSRVGRVQALATVMTSGAAFGRWDARTTGQRKRRHVWRPAVGSGGAQRCSRSRFDPRSEERLNHRPGTQCPDRLLRR